MNTYKHKAFGTMKSLLALKTNVYLVGPTGSGKSLLVEQVAQELGLDFYCQSVGAQTTMTNLMGYMDATGNYVSSALRRAYEGGGVFLIDEIDAGNANVFTCINSALSNSYCSFPDKMVIKHPNFLCVATANTFGTGRDYRYVGRNHLDAATLDRFAFLGVEYDTDLERALVNNPSWYSRLTCIRETVEEMGIDLIVSMRTGIVGAAMLADGFPRQLVEQMLLWKGLDPESTGKIIKNANKKEQERPEPEQQQADSDEEDRRAGPDKEMSVDEFTKDFSEKRKGEPLRRADDPLKNEGGVSFLKETTQTKVKLSLSAKEQNDR